MIRQITSSLETFRSMTFTPGFNMILADRTKDSTKKDTINGLGKSTMVDIIHFCLGARFTKASSRIAHPQLHGVSFSLELELYGHIFTVTRNTSDATFVVLTGDISSFPLQQKADSKSQRLSTSEWNRFLGQYWFTIPVDSPRKFCPSFRSVVSYFIRSGKDAFSEPFRHYRLQAVWDIQVNNAFLLGLVWEDASDWQLLKERKKSLDDLKQAAEEGFLGSVWGSRGQLEADRVRLEEAVKRTAADLKNFKVLSQYRELEKRADELSRNLQILSDENSVETKILEMYRESVRAEHRTSLLSVEDIYKTASVEFPGAVRKTLEEIETFHSTVIENRRRFLLQEVDRFAKNIQERTSKIEALHTEHTGLMTLLNTHGALDQYSKLQQAHFSQVARLNEIENRLSMVKRVEQGKAEVKLESVTLEQRAQRNYEDKHEEREVALRLFDSNAQALYKVAGTLMIDIGETGFKFDVEIDRKGSTGISNMEIFCYDLMLAEQWSSKRPTSCLLVHDSNIFADVDDRQVAAALELAKAKAESLGFQYICTFNSDKLPHEEFSPGFNVADYTRLTLTDETEDGGLLGTRLPSTHSDPVAEPEDDLFTDVNLTPTKLATSET